MLTKKKMLPLKVGDEYEYHLNNDKQQNPHLTIVGADVEKNPEPFTFLKPSSAKVLPV